MDVLSFSSGHQVHNSGWFFSFPWLLLYSHGSMIHLKDFEEILWILVHNCFWSCILPFAYVFQQCWAIFAANRDVYVCRTLLPLPNSKRRWAHVLSYMYWWWFTVLPSTLEDGTLLWYPLSCIPSTCFLVQGNLLQSTVGRFMSELSGGFLFLDRALCQIGCSIVFLCNLWCTYGHIWSVLEYSNLWDSWQVDSVLGDKLPNTEDMKNLKYTTRVINEVSRTFLTSSHEFCKLFWFGQVADMYKLKKICPWQSLRLYPQPTVLIRRSLESDVLGKYPIKK